MSTLQRFYYEILESLVNNLLSLNSSSYLPYSIHRCNTHLARRLSKSSGLRRIVLHFGILYPLVGLLFTKVFSHLFSNSFVFLRIYSLVDKSLNAKVRFNLYLTLSNCWSCYSFSLLLVQSSIMTFTIVAYSESATTRPWRSGAHSGFNINHRIVHLVQFEIGNVVFPVYCNRGIWLLRLRCSIGGS
jgi:hypothetical protein